MNHEHPHQPRHRADSPADQLPDHAPDTSSETYVRYVIERAATAETATCIADAYARHGTPFAIYLALDGVDKYVRDYGPDRPPQEVTGPAGIEAAFEEAYYASFPDREALIDDTIESFDWGTELARLLAGHVELEQFVVFDRDAIYEFAADHYEVINDDGELHVFWR